MSRLLRIRRLAPMLALMLMLAGCSGGGGGSSQDGVSIAPTPTPAAAGTPIFAKIGVIVPLQAGQTSFGIGIRNSVQLAVDRANAANTVPGVRFVVDARDDSSTPSVGAAAATSLAQDPLVVGVVGTYNSGVAAQTAPILKAAGIVQISPANTDPTLTLGPDPSHPVRPNANYFRVVVPDNIQGPSLADFAFSRGFRRVAVVTESKSVSQGLANDFSKRFLALGGAIVTTEVVPAGTTDYSAILARVALTNPDLLFYGGEYNSGGTTVRLQSRAAGINVPMMGGDGLKDDAYIAATGTASEGDFASTVGKPIASLPGGPEFLLAYQQAGFAEPPTDFGPFAFDAANIIIAAVRGPLQRGRIDAQARAAILANVQATNSTGVTGPLGFDAFGDTKDLLLTIYQVQHGFWIPVQ